MNRIKRLVVAKIHPRRYSKPNRAYYQEVELLDPDDNYAWYHTYIDEDNHNYAQWEKLLEYDYRETAFVIEGTFRRSKKGKRLISADAGFQIVETASREEMLPLIQKEIQHV